MKHLPSEMPANEARANFYQMIEEAGLDMRQFTITHRGKKPVIMMSVAGDNRNYGKQTTYGEH
jgi:PHD/YefM family antitoxin component YafN of YafNO toxin-antitoxin module